MDGKAAILGLSGRKGASTDLMNGKTAISQMMDSKGANAELHSMGAIPELMGGKGAGAEPMGSKPCAVTALRARGMRWVGAYSSTQLPRRHRPVEAEQAYRRCLTFRSSHRERSDGAWTLCLRSGHAGRNARR